MLEQLQLEEDSVVLENRRTPDARADSLRRFLDIARTDHLAPSRVYGSMAP